MKKSNFLLNGLAIIMVCLQCVVFMSCGSNDSKDDDDKLSVNPTSVEFDYDGGSQSVAIVCKGSWSVSAPDWVSVSSSQGSGNGTITLSTSFNDGDKRKGIIMISAGSATASINVSQDRLEFVPEG